MRTQQLKTYFEMPSESGPGFHRAADPHVLLSRNKHSHRKKKKEKSTVLGVSCLTPASFFSSAVKNRKLRFRTFW